MYINIPQRNKMIPVYIKKKRIVTKNDLEFIVHDVRQQTTMLRRIIKTFFILL